ncbi:MAG TPA: hypothetical protein VH186_23710 [Chloroflexia bacterium]|nr:hypothetical protein [Chloroflexia bacterium]
MKGIIAGIIAAIVLAIVILVVVFIWVPFDAVAKLGWMAVMITSFFACGLLLVTSALVAAVLVLIRVITNLTEDKVGPLIDKVNETADSAKGTVAYVGEGVVSPLIKISAILAGIRAAIATLFRGGRP